MGRKQKYSSGSTAITLNVENEVLDIIELSAKRLNKSRSEYISSLLKLIASNGDKYCKAMAKKAAQDLHYWKSRMEAIKDNPELF